MGGYQIPINLFSLGIGIGLISSMPLGPINLTLITTALRSEMQRSTAMAAVVALVDGGYAFAAVSALSVLRNSVALRVSIGLAGALVVVGYGVYLALSRNQSSLAVGEYRIPPSYRHLSVGALTGVALYVSNPTFVVFWLSTAGALHSWFSVPAPLLNRMLFGIGVAIGTGLWFGILLSVVRNTSIFISPPVARRLSLIASCLLIGFGSYVFVKLLAVTL